MTSKNQTAANDNERQLHCTILSYACSRPIWPLQQGERVSCSLGTCCPKPDCRCTGARAPDFYGTEFLSDLLAQVQVIMLETGPRILELRALADAQCGPTYAIIVASPVNVASWRQYLRRNASHAVLLEASP